MSRLHLTRNLRSIAFLLITTVVVVAFGTIWWANQTGLPASWRAAIEMEIDKQGAHVEIGGLSYIPLKGVVASKVRIFSDQARQHEISRLERVLLDFEKTKLARGIVRITKIELKDAELVMPVDPENPDSETLEINRLNGTLLMPGSRRFEVRNARGSIAGIEVNLNARVIGYRRNGETRSDASRIVQRRQLVARIIGEFRNWHFDAKRPPQVRVFIEGDANEPSSLNARISLTAGGVEKNQHVLDEVSVDAEVAGDLLTVTSLRARDSSGKLEGRLDYDIGDKEGRFDLQSSLEIPLLLKAWLALPTPKDVSIGGQQTLNVDGDFHLDDDNVPKVRMTGHARCESVTLRGVRFDSIESAFSWNNGDLFLRDVRLARGDGEAKGKAMIQWPLVRLAVESTLPEQLYKPFFIGQPLETVIGDFTDRKGAEVHVMIEGGFDATDKESWAYTGSGTVKNVTYKGVPVNLANCGFSLSHRELDFYDGTVVFNYQNYSLRGEFDGPGQATAKVGRIRFDAPSKTVEVGNVTGTFWAAPMVRLFAPDVADSLEVYRFHQPPELHGSGVVDVTPQGRTALDVTFRSEGAADYRFLGENLTLGQPSGKVMIRGDRVTIDGLKLNAFDGPVSGRFDVRGKGKMEGEMSWTRLSIPSLTSTYGFHMKGGGDVTGRLDFTLTDGKVETMNGGGLLALENTELFSVPMFGPLSSLVSGVLNDRAAGYQRASSAFCNFTIKDGILETRDFQTSTTSLTFAGDGQVDLKEKTLDMTMRMNARGLLGLITLPLRPFYGMFQFRGTGPLKDTKWENVMFTTPSKAQHEILLAPPKARVVNHGE